MIEMKLHWQIVKDPKKDIPTDTDLDNTFLLITKTGTIHLAYLEPQLNPRRSPSWFSYYNMGEPAAHAQYDFSIKNEDILAWAKTKLPEGLTQILNTTPGIIHTDPNRPVKPVAFMI